MKYRGAISSIVAYLREGYEQKGINIFNDLEPIRYRLMPYFSNQEKKEKWRNSEPPSFTIDCIIASVMSEIFGDLYITGEYNFNIVDNALDQLKRRGIVITP